MNNRGFTSDTLACILEVASKVFDAPVNPADNFFELGGDSISAVEISSRLERRLGFDIDVIFLVEAADFAAFADSLHPGNARAGL